MDFEKMVTNEIADRLRETANDLTERENKIDVIQIATRLRTLATLLITVREILDENAAE